MSQEVGNSATTDDRKKERERERNRILRRYMKEARQRARHAGRSLVCATGVREASNDVGPEAHAHCKAKDCLCECHD